MGEPTGRAAVRPGGPSGLASTAEEPPPLARRGGRVVERPLPPCSDALLRLRPLSASCQLFESNFVVSGCVIFFLHVYLTR